MLSTVTEQKYHAVQQALRAMGRVVVAFSGGVDSTLLLKIALDTLGAAQVLAVTGESPFHPLREQAEARALAVALGARAQQFAGDEVQDPRIAANPPDRCYYCKQAIFSRFAEIARAEGAVLVDGANADDTGDWRPGQQAARELGVRSPLQEADLSKAEVRALSRLLGLSTAAKPSFACLASRIPYGDPITHQAPRAVEAAEEFLRVAGFTQYRVRHHGNLARVEVPPADIPRLLDDTLRARLITHLRGVGYQYVTLDLQGYRTGSLNEVL